MMIFFRKGSLFLFFLFLTQCTTNSPYTSQEYASEKIERDEIWKAFVREYEQHFAIAETTTFPHTLISKPKIQVKGLAETGKILRVRRVAYGKLEKVKNKYIYSLRITLEVDRPEQFGMGKEQLLAEARSTWEPGFQELEVRPEDNYTFEWKKIGQDRSFEQRILESIEQKILPRIDT